MQLAALPDSTIEVDVDVVELMGAEIYLYIKSGEETNMIARVSARSTSRAGDKIKTELEESNRQLKLGEGPKQLPDIGFRVFELDESGIEKPEPGQLLFDVVKPDRSDMDIVFEMMLKWGLELTLPVEKSEAAGYPIWSVACDELVCCMSRGLTIEALEANTLPINCCPRNRSQVASMASSWCCWSDENLNSSAAMLDRPQFDLTAHALAGVLEDLHGVELEGVVADGLSIDRPCHVPAGARKR